MKILKIVLSILFFFISIFIIESFSQRKDFKNKDYDEIIFYRLNYNKSPKFHKNIFKRRIINGNNSFDEIDEKFEKTLLKMGYKKTNYPKEKLKQIDDKINSFGYGKYKYETSCLPDFRDILIYKKNRKIVKIIKICVHCYQNQVLTENEDTELLMWINEYDELKSLF